MKNMEKIGILFSVLLIIVTLFFAIQTGSPNSQNIPTNPDKTTAPPTVKKTVTTTITNRVTTIPVSSTSQVTQNPEVNNNGVIEYPGPVKIVNPLDLKVGDIIQRSTSDSRYDIDHAYRVETLFPQTNELLIKEIIMFKSENQWITMGSETGRLITSGALMRDYPNLIGHASGSLPQKCMICRLGPMTQCSKDDLIFTDC
jgi:hypothetical protein